jgi:hypothetical protein
MIITTYTAGGLGNLLFMIANAYSLSKKNNFEMIIYKENRDKNIGNTPRKIVDEYTIFKNFKIIEHDNIFNNFNKYHEKGFRYSEITLNDTLNYNLYGYYQSWKYFLENFDSFKKMLINNYEENINEHINKLKKEYNNIPIISVHFRRTDYLKHPNFHLNLDMNYYNKALEHFDKENSLFLFFSDDIKWVKEQDFSFLKNKIYIEELNEEYTLWLMSKCDHNIIANSSFSLWASYLNENSQKKIVSPSRWFGNSGPNYDINDIVIKNSIIIDI